MKTTKDRISNSSKKKSLKKNYFYNLIYQVFVLIVPLITAPYIARVLLPDGVGQYSFTFSLQNYFVLFAASGFGYYAQREIANFQNDICEQSKIFWEVNILRLVSVGIAIGVNLVLCFAGVYQTYRQLMIWWTLNIGAVAFDITFLLQGNEDFGKIVGRNVLIKAITVVLIFVLVNKSSDVWLYVLLTSTASLIGNLSLWAFLPKYLCKTKIHDLKPVRHFWPAVRLFIPTIATSVYTLLDKTLIGIMIPETYAVEEIQIIGGVESTVEVVKRYSDLENGYYEQSEKLVKMGLAIIGALGTIMIPRNSKLYAEGNQNRLRDNIYFATKYVWVIGVPMALGLAAIAPNLIPWFLGKGYGRCILLIQLFTPLIIFIGFSSVFGLQYLIPTKRDKKFTIGILAGAVSNLVLNCILIPFFWANGAVVASLCAEFFVTFTMYMLIRKEISLKVILRQSIKPIISGGCMFATVYTAQFFLKPDWYCTLALVFAGSVIYGCALIVLRDEFVVPYLTKAVSHLRKKLDN